jgi:hypothetical protein
MTAALTLLVGTLTQHQQAARLAQEVSQDIGAVFAAASGRDIQLRVVDGGRPGSRSGSLSSDDMHRALERMTGDQRGKTRVSNIGLLIADSFDSAPGFFGLMFDDMFRPGSSAPGTWTPREGAAVFLDAIEGRRGASQTLAEAMFTCVHELGHVFNLQHNDRPSYMYRSATGPLLPPSASQFVADDCRLLAHCSRSPHIWPGGAAFGDLGDLARSERAPDSSNGTALQLRIAVSQDAFWRFDPVELDVVLDNQGARFADVPDALDPSYSCFRIWIEEPDGQVRTLRPPRHYCAPRGVVRLAPGKGLARDISIFGESGGYTFRRAGPHRLWTSLDIAAGRALCSNVLAVEVLEQREDSRLWQDSAALLCRLQVAQLLYYRLPTPGRIRALPRLDSFSAAHRKRPVAAMARYAMGRALAVAALRRSPNSMAVLASDAQRHLRAVLRRDGFGAHRKQKAEAFLRALGQRLK